LGTALEKRASGKILIETLKSILQLNMEFIDLKLQQQYNDKDCGTFVVDNLITLANQNTNVTEAQLKGLLLTGNNNAQVLRQNHNKILISQADATTLLQEAVSLERKAMIEFLTKNAHLKQIESIESIDPIKDALIIAFGKDSALKDFAHAGKFLTLMSRNYSFSNPKIAKDFANLIKITVQHQKLTAEELRNTQEWQSLGGDLAVDQVHKLATENLAGDFQNPDFDLSQTEIGVDNLGQIQVHHDHH
jgi:hypothetical protein